MRKDMKMGSRPDQSYIDIKASIEVIPDTASGLPYPQRVGHPGYVMRVYDSFAPLLNLKIKAGTRGTINFSLKVNYDFWEFTEVSEWSGKSNPVERTGTAECGCTWDYACAKEGKLLIVHYEPEDSPSSDNFSVIVGKSDRSISDHKSEVYIIKVLSTSKYAGFATDYEHPPVPMPPVPIPGTRHSAPKVLMSNPDLSAFITITDKVVPPKPPVPTPPIPNFPPPLMTIIPFGKEGQRNLDDKAKEVASKWAEAMFKQYPQLRDPMMHGHIPVSFVGYASKSPPKSEKDEQKINDYNIDIGYDRAKEVAQYLTKPLGSGAQLAWASVGRQQAQWATVYDEKLKKTVEVVGKPRDIDRIVVVWLDYAKVVDILNKK